LVFLSSSFFAGSHDYPVIETAWVCLCMGDQTLVASPFCGNRDLRKSPDGGDPWDVMTNHNNSGWLGFKAQPRLIL